MGKVIVFLFTGNGSNWTCLFFLPGMSNVSIIHDIISPCCVLRGVQAFYWGERWGKSLSCCFAGKVIMFTLLFHGDVQHVASTNHGNSYNKRVKTIGMSNKIRSNAKIIVGCQIIPFLQPSLQWVVLICLLLFLCLPKRAVC